MTDIKTKTWIRMWGVWSVFLVVGIHANNPDAPRPCETTPAPLHVIKEIYKGGVLERTCEGDIAVSKCSGDCLSSSRPSAGSNTGFHKECKCCRESAIKNREVTLTKCYDPNGNALTGDQETYVIYMPEPVGCQCFHCGTSSPDPSQEGY